MRRFLPLMLAFAAIGCNNDTIITLGSAPLPGEQGGLVRVYFTTPDKPPASAEIVKALVGHISQARTTIDVAAFELDNVVITDALVTAVKRGVKVRLVTETNYLEESGVHALKAVGVPVVDDQRDGALMHNKFMVFDRTSVWMGSMNFTENCAYKNNNHGVFIDDVRVAENYATKFAWMHERHKFGGLPDKSARIPNPVVTLADGTRLENYFSTHDHIAAKLTEKIKAAQARIHFLAFSFTHKAMGNAMLARAAAGVEVQGVFEKSQAASGYSEYTAMRAAGGRVSVFLDANPRNMHHKVLILDDETVVAGSFNFSDGADKQNDENVVIFTSRPLVQRFEEEFQRVYWAAKQGDAKQTVKK
jgi:phosphatidylserine/phosphatidylglycerophosphate/cardiolipin synthase-like enzyme